MYRSLARLALVLAGALLATPASAGQAAAPSATWASDYKACTDRAILRHVSEKKDGQPLPPRAAVLLTEQDCADRLPAVSTSEVERVRDAVYTDLMLRFSPVTFASAPPPAEHDEPAVEQPIACSNTKTAMLAGSSAAAGRRYAVAVGMSIAVPRAPADWKVVACNSNQVTLIRADAQARDQFTAMAASIGLPAWTDEQTFEAHVQRVVEQSLVAGQRMRTTSVKASTLDGRPCLDVLRVGTLEVTAINGASSGPMSTRAHLRACHLRDARGPEAAVMAIIQEVSPHDPAGFDSVADPFIDSMRLPYWMR